MRALALLAVLLLATSLAAATYYVDPANGKPANDGSKAAPWSSLEEVVNGGLLARVKPGDTLLLRSGRHGRVVLSGDNADFITIAADKGHKPCLSFFEITAGSKWRIKGLTVSASFADKPYSGDMFKVADGGPSADIVVEDCFVYSTLDTSKWTAKDWMNANSGMTMGRHGTGHVFRNNYVLNTRFGIALCSENSVCEGNVVSHFSADGIRVTRDGQVVQHNVIRNIYVSDEDGDKNHDDAIQCFLFNVGTGTVRNVTIRENLIVMRENEQQKFKATMQGIGFFDGPLIGFTVDGNVINTSHWHGVSLYDAQDCVIRNNVAFTQWTDVKLRPWVMLGSKKKGEVKGNTVKDNYAYTYDLKEDKNVAAENNLPVTPEIHAKRQAELLALIEKKYGDVHPSARFRRLGLEKFRWVEGTVDAETNLIPEIESARDQGKPIVVYLYAAPKDKRGADACAKFEREVLDDAAIGEQLDGCVCVRLRLDDALTREARKAYDLGSKAPTLLILDAQGKKLYDASPPSLKTLLKQLQAARK